MKKAPRTKRVSLQPMTRRLAIAIAFGCAGAASMAHAQSTMSHARFVDDDRGMAALVDFPDVDFDVDVTVTCSGEATAKGRLREAQCSSPGDPDLKFTMAVSRRFNAARLVPAEVDGEPQRVDFQFSVVFEKTGENESIEVYHHNMKNTDRLGLDYLGAQRVSPWEFPNRCAGWRRDDLIIEAVIVDAEGNARDVNVMSSTVGLPASCRRGLLNQLENGRWIPASYRDQAVEAIWINPIVLKNLEFKRQQ